MENLNKMGGLKNVIGMIPGLENKVKIADIDEKQLMKQKAIIQSMTPAERLDPSIINGSRRKRIAQGSASTVPEVNKLIKQFEESKKMMAQFKNKKGFNRLFK